MHLNLVETLQSIDAWNVQRLDEFGVESVLKKVFSVMDAFEANTPHAEERQIFAAYRSHHTPDSLRLSQSRIFSKAYLKAWDLHKSLLNNEAMDPLLKQIAPVAAMVYERMADFVFYCKANLDMGLPDREAIDSAFIGAYPSMGSFISYTRLNDAINFSLLERDLKHQFSGDCEVDADAGIRMFYHIKAFNMKVKPIFIGLLYADLYPPALP